MINNHSAPPWCGKPWTHWYTLRSWSLLEESSSMLRIPLQISSLSEKILKSPFFDTETSLFISKSVFFWMESPFSWRNSPIFDGWTPEDAEAAAAEPGGGSVPTWLAVVAVSRLMGITLLCGESKNEPFQLQGTYWLHIYIYICICIYIFVGWYWDYAGIRICLTRYRFMWYITAWWDIMDWALVTNIEYMCIYIYTHMYMYTSIQLDISLGYDWTWDYCCNPLGIMEYALDIGYNNS